MTASAASVAQISNHDSSGNGGAEMVAVVRVAS